MEEPHSPFPSPPLPASPPHSFPSFAPSLLPPVSGEITAGLLGAALKSRENKGSAAQAAGEVEGVGGRWGDRRTPSCYDDGKALDSCLLRRAQPANVGAVFNLPPPLPDALMVEKARADF